MPELSVTEACTRCGICAAICPCRIVELPETGVARYKVDGAASCNLCGHCEAVCPSGAITVNDARLQPEPASPMAADHAPELDPATLGHYLRMRRSVRNYDSAPVPRAMLEQLMDVVRYAPSGRNHQNVRWLVIHDTAELRRLTGIAVEWMRQGGKGSALAERFNVPALVRAWDQGGDRLCNHAPHLFLAHAHRDDPFARNNALIALAHLDVVAPAFGLGTCWGGIFLLAAQACEPLLNALQLPPEQVPVHCLMLGYPALRYHRPPKRNPVSAVWR